MKSVLITGVSRGIGLSIAKEFIGDIPGACVDAKKAISLGDQDPKNKIWIESNC